jgi:L-iditol 2-dehydrogenase
MAATGIADIDRPHPEPHNGSPEERSGRAARIGPTHLPGLRGGAFTIMSRGSNVALAARLHPDRTFHVAEEPVPRPGPGDALIRVTAVGLCGSDRHWFVDGGIGDAVLTKPLVLGHEFAGIVETGALRGRRVAVDPAVSCGTCEPCQGGADNLCLRVRFAGHGTTDGALREYIAWPERCIQPVADTVDDAEAAMVEPLAVAIHGMDLAALAPGGTVAVVGCGPIGLLTVALARLAGAATIVASDPLHHRLDAAGAMGASHRTQVTGGPGDGRALLDATGGRGVDVVFEVSGEVAAVESAIAVARPGGRVVLLGIPPDDRTTFTASIARRKGLILLLSRRSTPDAFRRAVELAGSHTIDLASLVTLCVPLADVATAFDALANRTGLKVIVEPAGS